MSAEPHLVVRSADLTDAAVASTIVEILDAHARSATSHGQPLPAGIRARLAEDLLAHADVVVLLALADGSPVGVAVCLGGRSVFAPSALRLHDVAVTTRYAGDRLTVATALLEAGEALALDASRALRRMGGGGGPALYPRVGIDVLQDWEVCVGGSLTTDTYSAALREGLFVLSVDGGRRWCGPSRRAIYPLERIRWPSSVRRALSRPQFRVTVDQAFEDVVRACADRVGEPTWITEEIIAVQAALHARGRAHSVEVWNRASGALVGGIFGVASGAAFFGESMFHRETDASKVAFATLVELLRIAGFVLFDVQLWTPHLASLGCVDVPRERYREALADAVVRSASRPGRPPDRPHEATSGGAGGA